MTAKSEESKLTYIDLIRIEIAGKNKAQAGYDSILWKIRSGYAVILYGSLSLIVTSIDKKLITITPLKLSVILSIIIIGFSAFIALLDYHFLKCKIRVVDANNKLMDIAFKFSLGHELSEDDIGQLAKILHNSGESLNRINWKEWNSRSPLFLYLFTAILAVFVICITIYR